MSWFMLIIAVVLNALANVLIKASVNRLNARRDASLLLATVTEPLLYAGVAAFALALVAYAMTLRRLELSVAYPLMTSLGLVLVAIVSWRWLGEDYNLRKTAGTILVVAGVVLLSLHRGRV